jgi:uncharacterized membrane protein YphA (DoxX/SURF4 family)
MKNKKIKITYGVILTLLTIGLLMSAVPSVLKLPYAVEHFTKNLGYPEYLLVFTGIAKILGLIALFIPGYPRIKEWVFAGLTYDLLGAIYSSLSAGYSLAESLPIVIDLVLLASLYILYQKKTIQQRSAPAT